MRLITRLKHKLDKLTQKPITTPSIIEYLRPESFDASIQGVQNLCGVSTERSLNGVTMLQKPEMAKKMCHLLMKLAVRTQDKTMRDEAEE